MAKTSNYERLISILYEILSIGQGGRITQDELIENIYYHYSEGKAKQMAIHRDFQKLLEWKIIQKEHNSYKLDDRFNFVFENFIDNFEDVNNFDTNLIATLIIQSHINVHVNNFDKSTINSIGEGSLGEIIVLLQTNNPKSWNIAPIDKAKQLSINLEDARIGFSSGCFNELHNNIIETLDLSILGENSNAINIYLVNDDCELLNQEYKCNIEIGPSIDVIGRYLQASDYDDKPHIIISPTKVLKYSDESNYEYLFKYVLVVCLSYYYMDKPIGCTCENMQNIENSIASYISLLLQKGLGLDFVKNWIQHQQNGHEIALNYYKNLVNPIELCTNWLNTKEKICNNNYMTKVNIDENHSLEVNISNCKDCKYIIEKLLYMLSCENPKIDFQIEVVCDEVKECEEVKEVMQKIEEEQQKKIIEQQKISDEADEKYFAEHFEEIFQL